MSQANHHQQQVLSLAAFNRGAIITSYAQVEFLLADMVFRWRSYAGDDEGSLPYTLDSRIKAVREIMQTNPALAPYRQEVGELIDGLRPYREIRDMMAHAMQVLSTPDDTSHLLDYRMYRQAKGGFIEVGRMTTTLDQLANAALEIGRFSFKFADLWRRVYRDQGLPPVA